MKNKGRNHIASLILPVFMSFVLQSCFLINLPVYVQKPPLRDTIKVYHFIVSSDKKRLADSAYYKNSVSQSRYAYNWLSTQARSFNQTLLFEEHWPLNKDRVLNTTFVYKLPSPKLNVLILGPRHMAKWAREKTKDPGKQAQMVNWQKNLFIALAASVKDSVVAQIINRHIYPVPLGQHDNYLFVIHVLKSNSKKIAGFYNNSNSIFIGSNSSRTIAHESIHFLGAPDLYLHKYWIGKRRRLVKNHFSEEIMSDGVRKKASCSDYFISNYTRYCMGWDATLDEVYTPLLKQNLMALYLFSVWLN